mgnify:FL=1
MKKRKSQLNEKEKLNVLEELREFRNKVKKIILDVLKQYKDANLHSESARETIAKEMMKEFGMEEPKYIYESPDGGETIKKRKFEYKGGHLG